MKIGIITYAYRLAQPLDNLLTHILNESLDYHVYLFLHSTQPDVVAVCEKYQHCPRVTYHPYGFNRGLALSVNDGLIEGYADGCDVMMSANDDMIPGQGDIAKIAFAAGDHYPKCYFVSGSKWDGSDAEECLCAITKYGLEQIGYFDENCFPAYFEDTDWHWRARLAGLRRYQVTGTNIRHAGSTSIRTIPAWLHNERFSRVQRYFIEKWGGDEHHPCYERPFNDPRYDLKITAENRHNPYPEHQRRDYDELMEMELKAG